MLLVRQLCGCGVPPTIPHLRTTPLRLLLLLFALSAFAQEPPADVLQRIAENGTRFEKERARYTYRQTFAFFEYNKRGVPSGSYREVRDINFTTEGERTEEFIKGPANQLKLIRMTEEDFRDLRDMQPFVLTEDTLWRYKSTYRGNETIEGRPCFVFRIQPRQVLEGQRMLDGQIWIDQKSLQVVRAAGQPMPQLQSTSDANLFASFSTDYAPIDGEFWFPVKTLADDNLPFPSGVQRVSYEIHFDDYRRFTAETTLTFGDADVADPGN